MEDLLLLLDELDDLCSMAAAVWRPVASFVLAVAAFVAVGWASFQIPTFFICAAVVLLALGWANGIKAQRARPQTVGVDA